MKNQYYVIRAFRNGRFPSGYTFGATARFATVVDAEKNAAEFAAEVLPNNSHDYIACGVGAVRDGLSVGRGQRLAEYSVKGRELHGVIVRRDCRA